MKPQMGGARVQKPRDARCRCLLPPLVPDYLHAVLASLPSHVTWGLRGSSDPSGCVHCMLMHAASDDQQRIYWHRSPRDHPGWQKQLRTQGATKGAIQFPENESGARKTPARGHIWLKVCFCGGRWGMDLGKNKDQNEGAWHRPTVRM